MRYQPPKTITAIAEVFLNPLTIHSHTVILVLYTYLFLLTDQTQPRPRWYPRSRGCTVRTSAAVGVRRRCTRFHVYSSAHDSHAVLQRDASLAFRLLILTL